MGVPQPGMMTTFLWAQNLTTCGAWHQFACPYAADMWTTGGRHLLEKGWVKQGIQEVARFK